GAVEERAADAVPAVLRGDHEAEVGDMRARGMRVAREREPAGDLSFSFCDEDDRIGMAADGADVASLVADAAPLRPDQPALGLRADGRCERDERRRIAGLRAADVHSTTTAVPPRLGSPAPARPPSGRTSTALQ